MSATGALVSHAKSRPVQTRITFGIIPHIMPNPDAVELEREVQRIASAMWGKYPGSATSLIIDGRERDCVFRGEDVTHYVECTLQRAMAKVAEDSKKMVAYRESEIRRGKPVKLWYVTASDPTADQATVAQKSGIQILSLQNFRALLFDGRSYIHARNLYRWGSATDPKDESTDIQGVQYQKTALYATDSTDTSDILGASNLLRERKVVTLLGDFGMGKSLSIREIFRSLANDYLTGRSTKVPVSINLRDHWGQTDPAEVLTRHCSKIGFEKSYQLVRAYNAGEIYLLLDGFDEIVGIPVASKRDLRRLRSEALSVVRSFIQDCRGKTGVLVAGRQNFFDSSAERNSTLGTLTVDGSFELKELTVDEAEALLSSFHVRKRVPSWLPKRPLFLAYLASQGFLADLNETSAESASNSWDRLIDAICQREKKINDGLEAAAIRGILEYLADETRRTSTGRGPLYSSDVLHAYRHTTGYEEPDEHYRPLLMRLPALTSRNSEDGSREFIDDSMLNALRAPRLARFASLPYSDPDAQGWKHGISSLGLQIACDRRESGVDSGRIMSAAREAADRWKCGTLAADLLRASLAILPDDQSIACHMRIVDARLEDLDLSEVSCSDLEILECDLGVVSLPSGDLPRVLIRDGMIETVLNIPSAQQLPGWIVHCEIGVFDATPTNSSILEDMQLDIPHRVLLTIFRKLFVQPGSGRLEGALTRGLPGNYRPYVAPILEMLSSANFASLQSARQQRIWSPERGRTGEVLAMLSDYGRSKNALVTEVRKLRL
jgi:hypothetical protein